MRMFMLIVAAILAATPEILFPEALAQVDHANRVATELAARRAQVRAQMCPQQQPGTAADTQIRPLPTYPPVGTGGPVPCPVRR